MLTATQTEFAQLMVAQSKLSGHPWAGYAAAEACLESTWGASGLAVRDKDVFGLKTPSWWKGQIDEIQTREVINGVSEMMLARWPVFATYADAFAARLHVLRGLPGYYAPALAATSGEEFIRLVSASWRTGDALPVGPAHPIIDFPTGTYQFDAGRWSTDPDRAPAVLEVYDSHPNIFAV